MKCPGCSEGRLEARATNTGVELDRCSACGSVWFDRGEILFFVKHMRELHGELERARKAAQTTELASPKSGHPLVSVSLKGQTVHLDRSQGGIWLSGETVTALERTRELSIGWHDPAQTRPLRFRLPNLAARTLFTLTGLYALLSGVLIALSLAGGISVNLALGAAVGLLGLQFLLGPFIMDFFLRFAYSAHWVEFGELPAHLRTFVTETCTKNRMKIPRFAVIDDLSPNAFTYGHTPQNARVVVTQGLFELLEPRELEGVVAHEIGHARNWDMALMTLAQLVPMVLYWVYRAATRIRSDNSQARAAAGSVAIGAFLLYIVSEYVVLWFSRTREYYADRFSAHATGSPAALAGALVKVAYGLASRSQPSDGAKGARRGGGRASAIGALGIFDAGHAQTLAISSRSQGNLALDAQAEGAAEEVPRYTIDPEALKGAMKWDLWNPWARWFELNSTHPLVAKRLLQLSELSLARGEEPLVRFDLPQPESYWDEFLVDLGIKVLPWAAGIGALGMALAGGLTPTLGLAVAAVGVAMALKLSFRYPTGSFPEMSVSTLLRQVKVSDVRPVPCRLEGTVRGKGVPGLIWSDDFVMQDDTGILFLDHRQPLAIWEAIWGWMRGNRIVGKHVVVQGWYRRAPVPYVEIERFTVEGVTRRSWLRHFRWFTVLLVIAAGVAIRAGVLG